jgi:hypothetical protein
LYSLSVSVISPPPFFQRLVMMNSPSAGVLIGGDDDVIALLRQHAAEFDLADIEDHVVILIDRTIVGDDVEFALGPDPRLP